MPLCMQIAASRSVPYDQAHICTLQLLFGVWANCTVAWRALCSWNIFCIFSIAYAPLRVYRALPCTLAHRQCLCVGFYDTVLLLLGIREEAQYNRRGKISFLLFLSVD